MIDIGQALQINITVQILDILHNISDNGTVVFSEYVEVKNLACVIMRLQIVQPLR